MEETGACSPQVCALWLVTSAEQEDFNEVVESVQELPTVLEDHRGCTGAGDFGRTAFVFN